MCEDRQGQTATVARSPTLAELVYPKTNRRRPERANPEQRVTPGSIGLLDTHTDTFEYIHDGWLAEVCGDHLDLSSLVEPSRSVPGTGRHGAPTSNAPVDAFHQVLSRLE